jgi:hypothetical protein
LSSHLLDQFHFRNFHHDDRCKGAVVFLGVGNINAANEAIYLAGDVPIVGSADLPADVVRLTCQYGARTPSSPTRKRDMKPGRGAAP